MISTVDSEKAPVPDVEPAVEEVGLQVLELQGNRALASMSQEMRAVLETFAAHVLAQKRNEQAIAEAGIGSRDIPKAAKTLVAVFASAVICTHEHPLTPVELAIGIADRLGGEVSEQEVGKLSAISRLNRIR
jgi:hypothetical protein